MSKKSKTEIKLFNNIERLEKKIRIPNYIKELINEL